MTRPAPIEHPKTKTVLVVDDEFLIAELIASELEAAGWRVIRAPNGRKGLDAFGAESPDLVITDFNMPEMNGQELATQIQATKSGVPIILVSSAHGRFRSEKLRMFAAAFDKPVNLFQLTQEATRLLGDTKRASVEAPRCH